MTAADEPKSFRQERIEKLLTELKYEITRGMMEREIYETQSFEFFVPVSNAIPDGVVHCSFRTRPVHRLSVPHVGINAPPALRFASKDGG